MHRLKDVRREEMPELVRLARRLHEEDQALARDEQERQSLAEAARELGVPLEYLERAALRLQEGRARRGRRAAWLKGGSLFALGAACGVAGALLGPSRTAPPAFQRVVLTERVVTAPGPPAYSEPWFPGGTLEFTPPLDDSIILRIPDPPLVVEPYRR